MPLELELCAIDEEADIVAVSIIVSSASLADWSDDSSSRGFNISKVMALRYTCSISSISPSEDKDSLCIVLRLFFFETVLWRFSLRAFLSFRDAFGLLFAFLRDHSRSLPSMERQSCCYAGPSWKGSL